MPDLTSVLKLIGAISVVVAAIFALRSLYQWLRPIRIIPAIKMVLDKSGPDQILAAIMNVSREDQVLVRCVARSTYPLSTILRSHLGRPLTRPKLYSTIWYAPRSYELMGASPITLKPSQRETLHHSLQQRPDHLHSFTTPMIQIEAQLSTGRIFRSSRLEIPARWMLTHRLRQSR
jgi:hypothetical protein